MFLMDHDRWRGELPRMASHSVSAGIGLAEPFCFARSEHDPLKLKSSAGFPWLGEERTRMTALTVTEAQKAVILQQGAQGTPVAELCRTAGISLTTYVHRRAGG